MVDHEEMRQLAMEGSQGYGHKAATLARALLALLDECESPEDNEEKED